LAELRLHRGRFPELSNSSLVVAAFPNQDELPWWARALVDSGKVELITDCGPQSFPLTQPESPTCTLKDFDAPYKAVKWGYRYRLRWWFHVRIIDMCQRGAVRTSRGLYLERSGRVTDFGIPVDDKDPVAREIARDGETLGEDVKRHG
jgi:hypothetical protein